MLLHILAVFSGWWLFSLHALDHVQVFCMSRATFTVSGLWSWRCCPVSLRRIPTAPRSKRTSSTGQSHWLTGGNSLILWTPGSRANTTPNKPCRRCVWHWAAWLGSLGAGPRWRWFSRRSSRSRQWRSVDIFICDVVFVYICKLFLYTFVSMLNEFLLGWPCKHDWFLAWIKMIMCLSVPAFTFLCLSHLYFTSSVP